MDRVQQIMQKVRRIEMQARKLASATFSGEYRSSFRGQGLDFDDFREYTPGDEPRFIDWKVTARTGTPYVRKFREEREQVLLLAVDVSGSMHYAGAECTETKLEYAALISAVLAYSAAKNGDKAGLLLFGEGTHFYLPPAKGMKQCLRIVREVLSATPGGADTSVDSVVTGIMRSQRKSAMVFLISDFLMPADKRAIGRLDFRHEVIPIRLADPAELELPTEGRVYVQDPESGGQMEVDLGSAALRTAYERAMQAHRVEWERIFNQLGVDFLDISTNEEFVPALRRLFHRRSQLFVR